jgi:hypothetical protein
VEATRAKENPTEVNASFRLQFIINFSPLNSGAAVRILMILCCGAAPNKKAETHDINFMEDLVLMRFSFLVFNEHPTDL